MHEKAGASATSRVPWLLNCSGRVVGCAYVPQHAAHGCVQGGVVHEEVHMMGNGHMQNLHTLIGTFLQLAASSATPALHSHTRATPQYHTLRP
jgi:hypothetical protein